MSARSSDHFLLTLGALHVPVKLYATASARPVRFHLVHEPCVTRVRQQYTCPTHGVPVERSELVRSYEVARDTEVVFTEAELAALDAPRSGQLVLELFVGVEQLRAESIERTWVLGPDKGGDPGFALLAAAFEQSDRAGICRRWTRGREQLCAVVGRDGRLWMLELFYAHERVALVEVPGATTVADPHDVQLAVQLVERLAVDALPDDQLEDRYQGRIEAAAKQKLATGGITVRPAPEQPAATGDLRSALRESLRVA